MEFDEQIPDSFLPLLVFSFFRLGDAAERSLFQRIHLLLRELDQFVVEQFLIVRCHDMTSERSRTIGGMTGCPKRLDAGNDGAMITTKLEILFDAYLDKNDLAMVAISRTTLPIFPQEHLRQIPQGEGSDQGY